MMKLLFLVPILALVATSAAGLQKSDKARAFSVRLSSSKIVSVTDDDVKAEIELSVSSKANVRIEHLLLSNIHIDGIPAFADPVHTAVDLRRDQSVPLKLHVTLYFNDLNSTAPLFRIFMERKAEIDAEASVTVQATTLQHLFLGTAHPVVFTTIHQSMEFSLSEGLRANPMAIIRKLGQRVLTISVAQKDDADSGRPLWYSEWIAAKQLLYRGHVCSRGQNAEVAAPACRDQFAFPLRSHGVLCSAELLAPWDFDPTMRENPKQKRHEPHLELSWLTESDLPVPPVVSTRRIGIPVFHTTIMLPKRERTEVAPRVSPHVIGEVETSGPSPGRGFPLAPTAVLGKDHWDRLLVFTMICESGKPCKSRPIELTGSAADGIIVFNRPVDRSAIGSPILSPEGVVGLVQDETGGTVLTNIQ